MVLFDICLATIVLTKKSKEEKTFLILHNFLLNQDCLLFLLRITAFKTPVEALVGRGSDKITSNRETNLNQVKANALTTTRL
jgi:hypothetical protein